MSLFRSCFKNSEGIPGSSENNHELRIHRLTTLDLEHKYINAIRTASFKKFEEKARNLRSQHNDEIQELPSSSSCQLKPFILIVDQLVEPGQETVEQKLNESEQKWKKIEIYKLMQCFFDQNLEACRLCGRLIDFIEKATHYINCLEDVLSNVEPSQELQVVECLYKIASMENLFPDLDFEEVKDVCNPYNTLYERLEKNKQAAGKKKFRFAYFQNRNLVKHKAQLDAAMKESYHVNVSLQTIDHSVKLLYLDLSTIRDRVEFVREHQELFHEVIEEVMKKPEKVLDNMKVIEERAFFLFYTINRARESVTMAISQM